MTLSQLIRVLIVDDQPAVRSALEAALFLDDDLQLVGTAKNGLEAVSLCRERNPNVVLMDIRMPEMDGVEATRQIRQTYPQIAVLAITSFLEPALVQNMVKAGAMGYLLKDINADQLSNAIRATYAGESVMNKEAYKILFETTDEVVHQETGHEHC